MSNVIAFPAHTLPEDIPPGHVNSAQLAAAAHLTYRKLDHWTRVGYLHAVDSTPGSGYVRIYRSSEVPLAVLMARLVVAGLAPAAAYALALQLLSTGHAELAGIRIDLPTEP